MYRFYRDVKVYGLCCLLGFVGFRVSVGKPNKGRSKNIPRAHRVKRFHIYSRAGHVVGAGLADIDPHSFP